MSPDPTMSAVAAARPSRLRQFLRRGVGERAMAATEFALVLPVALILFTGSYIYGTVNEINRKVTLTTRDVTDLVTQYSAISSSDMTMLLNSASQVMAPFSASGLTLIVSEVTTDSSGNYCFMNLTPGTTYYVIEVVPSGYLQTGGGPNGSAGSTYYTITAQSGTAPRDAATPPRMTATSPGKTTPRNAEASSAGKMNTSARISHAGSSKMRSVKLAARSVGTTGPSFS